MQAIDPQQRQQSKLSQAIKVKDLLAVLKKLNKEAVINFTITNFQIGDSLSIDEWEEVVYIASSSDVKTYTIAEEVVIKKQFPSYIKQHIVTAKR